MTPDPMETTWTETKYIRQILLGEAWFDHDIQPSREMLAQVTSNRPWRDVRQTIHDELIFEFTPKTKTDQ
jgi:hypothetical protein